MNLPHHMNNRLIRGLRMALAVVAAVLGNLLASATTPDAVSAYGYDGAAGTATAVHEGVDPGTPSSLVPTASVEVAVSRLASAESAGTTPRLSFVAPSETGQRIALGLGDDLDDFAGAQGAITYRDFPGGTGRFADDFYESAGNPSNDVLFNLDGVRNPWSSVQRAGDLTLDEALRAGASITDWELAQIYRNNWTHVQFFENGVPVPSPFG